MPRTPRRTVLLVDGENIDATLGSTVLERRPEPSERPRWDRVRAWAEELWGQEVVALFFLNATNGHLPTKFIGALRAVGYRPVPLAGTAFDQKVVDIGIQRTLDALLTHDDDVLLVSHDGDFLPHMTPLLGSRRLGVVGFPEFVNSQYDEHDIEIFDLEHDVAAFNVDLPRTRIISLDVFDPEVFLR
jgi:putative heme uptake system protein